MRDKLICLNCKDKISVDKLATPPNGENLGDIRYKVFVDKDDCPRVGRVQVVSFTPKFNKPRWCEVDTKDMHYVLNGVGVRKTHLAALKAFQVSVTDGWHDHGAIAVDLIVKAQKIIDSMKKETG